MDGAPLTSAEAAIEIPCFFVNRAEFKNLPNKSGFSPEGCSKIRPAGAFILRQINGQSALRYLPLVRPEEFLNEEDFGPHVGCRPVCAGDDDRVLREEGQEP